MRKEEIHKNYRSPKCCVLGRLKPSSYIATAPTTTVTMTARHPAEGRRRGQPHGGGTDPAHRPAGAVLNSRYELIEYVNDVNREYVEVLVEQNGGGRTDTTYTYGVDRISMELFNQTAKTSYYPGET